MNESACTINESFMGVMLGDCGEPAASVTEYRCDKGHLTPAPMCAAHGRQFLGAYPPRSPMFCTDCYEAGDMRSEAKPSVTRKPDPATWGQPALFREATDA